MVDDPDSTVGLENMSQFGNGSDDHDIVYIRNNRIACDFEVVRNKGSYAELVHAVSPKHTRDKHKMPRMKDEE